MADELVYANGVNGLTGEYLLAPLAAAQVAELAKAVSPDPAREQYLNKAANDLTAKSFGLPFNADADDPASAGWGIVLPTDGAAELQEALQPLIDHRTAQIGPTKTKVLFHLPDEQWASWLGRHGVGPGTVEPTRVPYYLLLVGPPTQISFEMQYLLDVEYAVGRIDFDDLSAYRRYAQSVVDYETSAVAARDASAVFFGTRHPNDPATTLSADQLVEPLATSFMPGGRFADAIPKTQVYTSIGPDSNKAALTEVLRGTGRMGTPALFFAATHGMGGWPAGDPRQAAKQGALLCQDWPGVGRIGADQYFAASDLPPDARVAGLVAFFFACYGAGTPSVDAFAHTPGQAPSLIAPNPFVAALPKALLSHAQGSALAAVGHIERAWSVSIESTTSIPLLTAFQNALGWILLGKPVGYAMKDFNEKYAVLSAGLSSMLENVGWGIAVADEKLAFEWLQRNDAQNYVLLGDPATHLNVA